MCLKSHWAEIMLLLYLFGVCLFNSPVRQSYSTVLFNSPVQQSDAQTKEFSSEFNHLVFCNSTTKRYIQ